MSPNSYPTARHARARQAASGPRRRGALYIAVLFCATLISVIGIAGLLLLRLNARDVRQTRTAFEARVAARAAIEATLYQINQREDWRNAASDPWQLPSLQLEGITITVTIEDTTDYDISNNPSDGVTIEAIAEVDGWSEGYRVYAIPVEPLDCLNDAICTDGWQEHEGRLIGSGGLTTHDMLFVSWDGYLDIGRICADSYIAFGTVIGGIRSCPVKEMPNPSLLAYYRDNAVDITLASIPDRTIEDTMLSPQHNPFGGTAADNGLYRISIGSSTLTITNCRIEGTLLIEGKGGTVKIAGPVVWQPAVANYPALLTSGINTVNIAVEDELEEQKGDGYGGSQTGDADKLPGQAEVPIPTPVPGATPGGLNFNPIGFPLDGEADVDYEDSFPARLNGLIYTSAFVNIEVLSQGKGAIVVANSLYTEDSGEIRYDHDPDLLEAVPIGFHTHVLDIQPGSWERLVP